MVRVNWKHDVKAQIPIVILDGFDGIQPNLAPLPPVELVKKYVNLGGKLQLIEKFSKSVLIPEDFRVCWLEVMSMQFLQKTNHKRPGIFLADTYEQLGLSSWIRSLRKLLFWRSTKELAMERRIFPVLVPVSPDMIRGMSNETVLQTFWECSF